MHQTHAKKDRNTDMQKDCQNGGRKDREQERAVEQFAQRKEGKTDYGNTSKQGTCTHTHTHIY